jgi:hypothetical protein
MKNDPDKSILMMEVGSTDDIIFNQGWFQEFSKKLVRLAEFSGMPRAKRNYVMYIVPSNQKDVLIKKRGVKA